MAKESYQIKFEDKVPGAEMTASDFNQIKHQHNNYTGSTRLKGNVSTELGNASDLTCTQKIITDTLQGKVGEDNVITGEGVSTSRVLNQDSATKVLQNYQDNEEFLDEQGYWERSKLHPKQLGAQGLKFKAGDNSVFAKTAKALALGTGDFTVCVIARTEGCAADIPKAVFNAGATWLAIYGTENTNDVNAIRFNDYVTPNRLIIRKNDSTKNIHHIVITRSSYVITCTVNGRLFTTATIDKLLDFSNFFYDIKNTSYFYGGYVFNYAMTQAESNKLLWNGGRYDEVRLSNIYRNAPINTEYKSTSYNSCNYTIDNNITTISLKGNVLRHSIGAMMYSNGILNKGTLIRITYDIMILSNNVKNTNSYRLENVHKYISGVDGADVSKIGEWQRIDYVVSLVNNTTELAILWADVRNSSAIEGEVLFSYKNLKTTVYAVLLEYRPENIRSDRYLNTGTAGSDYDLIYSATPPEIIYERPYSDLTIQSTNPTHHPIAVGQQVIIPDGNIYTAVEPPMNREWSPEDFKLTATP